MDDCEENDMTHIEFERQARSSFSIQALESGPEPFHPVRFRLFRWLCSRLRRLFRK